MPDVLASKLTVEHAREVVRSEQAALQEMRSVYREARLGLLGRLAQSRAESFTAQGYRVTLAQVQKSLAELERKLRRQGRDRVVSSYERGVAETLEQIAFWESARGFKFGAHGRIQQRALRRVMKGVLLDRYETSVQAYGTELIAQVQRRLGVHLAMRSKWTDMATDIAGRLGRHQIQGARWKAERIVRTEMIHALNAGHKASLEQAATVLPGLQQQWDAFLDARTCPICIGLEGQVQEVGAPFHWGGGAFLQPPDPHPSCRCTLIPWRQEWAGLLAKHGAPHPGNPKPLPPPKPLKSKPAPLPAKG